MEVEPVAGLLLRAGVTVAVCIAPLIALASVAWVVLVRRLGHAGQADTVRPTTRDPGSRP